VTVVAAAFSIEMIGGPARREKIDGESSEEGADQLQPGPLALMGALRCKSLTRSCNGLSIDWFDPAALCLWCLKRLRVL